MNDKELLFLAFNNFVKSLVLDLFKINTVGTDALITYVVNNMYDKYNPYLDLFTDKNGNINVALFNNALKDILKNQFDGKYVFTIFGKSIKFTLDDIDEFGEIFKTLKENNGKHKN